jgi:transcriptional regulator with XRE-family HTH domain
MDDIHKRLVKNVKKHSKAKKMTFERLAVELDKDKAHLSRVLSGNKKANLDLVQRLADALGVDVQKLFKP